MLDNEIERLINKFETELHSIAKKYYLLDGGEDDLYQEALIGFADGVKSFDWTRGDENSEAFKKFAFMCAKRQILDAVKKSNSKKNKPLNDYISFTLDGDQEVTDFANLNSVKTTNPEQIVLEKFDRQEKEDSIKLILNDSEREVLNLYLDGLGQSSIAATLGKTPKNIDNILQRIKQKLRNR